MSLYRDPNTGIVWDPRDVPKDILLKLTPKDDKAQEIHNARFKHVNEERSLQTQLPDYSNLSTSHFKIGLDDPLLVQEHNSLDAWANTCQNVADRPGMWAEMTEPRTQVRVDAQAPFLNQLGSLCVKAQLRQCSNHKCVESLRRMERYAPQCEWPRFREWALVLVSCQTSLSHEEKMTLGYQHLVNAARLGFSLLNVFFRIKGNKTISGALIESGGRTRTLDLFGICEIIYWLITIQTSLGIMIGIEKKWGPEFLPPDVTGSAVRKAVRKADKLGICEYRFWNLALVSERKHIDFPALMETAVKYPFLKHKDHEKCTAGFCHSTIIDTTKVLQSHKCGDTNTCGGKHFTFDPELLNESIKGGGRTVWSTCEPFRISQDEPYVAISHVWSDGTGIGLGKVGEVNCCLFNYFAEITRRLDCHAIWWDTISIPTNEAARRKAINEMHKNYSSARCTVVHDEYLVNFPWADDGSPCLALIFSAWLTRGWTALELIMSRNVKAIFKGDDGPVIKDLDLDILADNPSQCSRAHWIASVIMRRLRRPIDNVTELVAVLKPRKTCWPRDKMVIAGLLSGLDDFDYGLQSDEITKAIMGRVFKIYPSSLLHGQPTMCDSGGWSWCPSSLYDIPADIMGDILIEGSLGDNTCWVEQNGAVAGNWHYRLLRWEDSVPGRLVANSMHPSVVWKIENAVRNWRHCLLLKEWFHIPGPALLVTTVGRDARFIHCRYISSVYEILPPSLDEMTKGYGHFKIGYDRHRSGVEAEELIQKDSNSSIESKEDYQWLHGKLWMGDQAHLGELLVTTSNPETGSAKGFSLQIRDDPISTKPYSLGPDRLVVHCDPQVSLSEKPVFHVASRRNSHRKSAQRNHSSVLTWAMTTAAWPPTTIPAEDRIGIKWVKNDAPSKSDYSRNIFRLETSTNGNTFAAIDRRLFTPEERRPYCGIWAGVHPFRADWFSDYRWEFLLFHQPTEKRLEVIKLTGDYRTPRGAHMAIVEDLHDIKRVCTEEEWPGAPSVAAMGKAIERVSLFHKVTLVPAELVLVNKNEVVLITRSSIIRMKRILLDDLLPVLTK